VVAALTYFVACKAGLTLATANPNATAVWPGSGIAFASFMLLGYGIWPAIFSSAFLVNMTTAGSVLTSLGIASGNTLEGLVGVYLVRRFANGPLPSTDPATSLGSSFLPAL
jgi:integral membrane sensor domain MASE1